jgi:hypothetical protein
MAMMVRHNKERLKKSQTIDDGFTDGRAEYTEGI